jgi:taurine dioxygenase
MSLEILPMAGSLGAEVLGVDLSKPLDAATRDAIAAALHSQLVLFFPKQRLSPAEHLAFASAFGAPEGKHPFIPHAPESEQVAVLSAKDGGRADVWHTDVTFSPRPPLGSILHMKLCPSHGGDTMWANMIAAYEALSEPMKRFLDGLTAQHEVTAAARVVQRKDRFRELDAGKVKLPENLPNARHPVVRTHPVTGRKSLFVNPAWTARICELAYAESEALLEFLFAHAVQPEFTVRRRWSEGDVGFWDNRCTMHYAIADYGDAPRVIHRVTLQGEVPA